MGKSSARIGAASCYHSPHTDMDALEWQCRELSRARLDYFVLLGDLFEADAASVHPSEDDTTLIQEYQRAAKILGKLRTAVGKRCKLIWTLGNHDDNLIAQDPRRIDRKVRDLIHWNRHHEEFTRWHQVPYEKSPRGVVQIGCFLFTHGFDAGGNSDQLEAIQVNNLKGGLAHRLVIRGHTHRPRDVEQIRKTANIPLPLWCANVGHTGPAKPGYVKRRDTSAWGNGLFIGETRTTRTTPQRDHWAADILIR